MTTEAKPLSFAKHANAISDAKAALTEAVAAYESRFKSLVSKEGTRPLPQDALAAFRDLAVLADLIGKAQDAAKAAILAHKAAGGAVEAGGLGLILKETSRRSPKWQEIAIDNAEQLAAALGKGWAGAEAYKASVIAETVPSTSTSVKVEQIA